ncbi:MAG: flavodoxin-dependent (E)-4-hydroxy-3-methylbut-2-enyl-diphosphate synthase [Clostridiales bacterium]|nr:flavodoxin-dependent (E)-4-hydroxy-3-methylbut-2-enyl-diphosphate synthase [Clostridiales bacterium]
MERKKTRVVRIGDIAIGGSHPIAIQSMTNTDTANAAATIRQIDALAASGCEIIRIAVPHQKAADAVAEIKRNCPLPLVADIHFDWQLALRAIESGVDKLRINPGNIGGKEKVRAVAAAAKERGIPIRIGVNAGSLESAVLKKHGGITPAALFESAMGHVHILEEFNFENIVLSIKSSDVALSLDAYRLLSEAVDYPLHIGITESGTVYSGAIKSAAGIGAMLSQGIGDTLRVSLTGDPLEEIRCAKEILKAMGLRQFGATLISCPTCGRTEIDLIGLAERVEKELAVIQKPLKVAVMGCVVNGPGEAKEADIGIAGGQGYGMIFRKGEIVKKVSEAQLLDALMKEIHTL